MSLRRKGTLAAIILVAVCMLPRSRRSCGVAWGSSARTCVSVRGAHSGDADPACSRWDAALAGGAAAAIWVLPLCMVVLLLPGAIWNGVGRVGRQNLQLIAAPAVAWEAAARLLVAWQRMTQWIWLNRCQMLLLLPASKPVPPSETSCSTPARIGRHARRARNAAPLRPALQDTRTPQAMDHHRATTSVCAVQVRIPKLHCQVQWYGRPLTHELRPAVTVQQQQHLQHRNAAAVLHCPPFAQCHGGALCACTL